MHDLISDEELEHLTRDDLDLLIEMVAKEAAAKRTVIEEVTKVLDFEIKGEGDHTFPEEIPEALKMMKRMMPGMYKSALVTFKNTELKSMGDTVVLLINLQVKLHLVKSKID
jgi:hypothetical protein